MALEVIGPGFGRTGTNSLQLALEQLGFGPCHHMHEVGNRPELLPAWDAVSRGVQPDWDAMFEGYRAQVDWPGARFWRELSGHYPDAKVVLTVRDPDEWYNSFSQTIAPFMDATGNIPDPHGNAISIMVPASSASRSSMAATMSAPGLSKSSTRTSPKCRRQFRVTAC